MILEKTWAEQDLQKHEQEQERWLSTRPVCDMCQEPIQEDFYFEPEPGDCLCEDCFRMYARDNLMRLIPETE